MTLSFFAFLRATARPALQCNLRPPVPLRALVAATLLANIGCGASSERTCTAVGCTDQVEIKLNTTTGSWAEGVDELDARADDQLVGTCTLRLPEQLPSVPGSGFTMQCGQGIHFGLSSEMQCGVDCDGNACTQHCWPIPSRLEMRLSVTGTPRQVHFTLVRDGQLVVGEKIEPAYQDAHPNRLECPGHCREAKFERTVE